MPGSRLQPDGPTLEWETADITGPEMPLAPFLIEWSAASAHPSTTTPEGCLLQSVEILDPNSEPLARLIDAMGLDVQVAAGPERRMILELVCDGRTVAFGRD
jgi:hypothetical protein